MPTGHQSNADIDRSQQHVRTKKRQRSIQAGFRSSMLIIDFRSTELTLHRLNRRGQASTCRSLCGSLRYVPAFSLSSDLTTVHADDWTEERADIQEHQDISASRERASKVPCLSKVNCTPAFHHGGFFQKPDQAWMDEPDDFSRAEALCIRTELVSAS